MKKHLHRLALLKITAAILAIGSLILTLNACVAPAPHPERQFTPNSSDSIGDDEAQALMYTLLDGSGAEIQQAIARIQRANDQRFIPVYIELVRGVELRIVPGAYYQGFINALENLSGQTFGNDWFAWVEWYGSSDLTPPPGFTTWKGILLSTLDPPFAEFLLDEHPSHIRAEEIRWGMASVDGIPVLNDPAMVAPAEATWLEPGEPVFGVAVNGEARAYPLRILDWHEIVNDTIGGVPVTLAYCPLCGAGIAYDGRRPDGSVYTFGSSGLLYRSNKLMYDHQTRTLWHQMTGEPAMGELAAVEGLQLDLLPLVLTTWADWQSQHPETQVLDLATGYERTYGLGTVYGGYFASDLRMFPVWQRSPALDDKAQVYGLQVDGVARAYPLSVLAAGQVVNDTLNGVAVVLVATRGTVEVDGEDQRMGAVTYAAGGEVRAYAAGEVVFSPGPDADTLRDSAGQSWQVTEEGLLGPDGEVAPRLAGHLAYWFGWFTFYPDTSVYGE